MRPRVASRRALVGFTLFEMLVGGLILSILVGTFVRALDTMLRYESTNTTVGNLQTQGEKALDAILEDLGRSGFVQNGGTDYPFLFTDGVAPAPHAHDPAPSAAQAGDVDFGPSREIVFVLPADGDLDGVPDLDAAGDLVWAVQELSYVVVSDANGINVLERRIDGATQGVVAKDVERIVFDDVNTSLGAVPQGAVRVRIFFRKADRSGQTFRHSVELTMSLRNG